MSFICIISVDLFVDGVETSLTTVTTLITKRPRDCFDIYDAGVRLSGVYIVYIGRTQSPVEEVYCDMMTDGGGWTVCVIM